MPKNQKLLYDKMQTAAQKRADQIGKSQGGVGLDNRYRLGLNHPYTGKVFSKMRIEK